MEQVINDFIKELTARITILNTMSNKLDSSGVDSINEIINKYGTIDTKLYEPKDIEKISEIMRIPISDPLFKDYNKLNEHIINYIREYHIVKATHEDNKVSEQSVYQKYIDILSNDDHALFIDFEELDNLMFEFGISISDKWKIISYLNSRNINNNSTNILAINLNSKLITLNKLYLSDDKLKDTINDYVKNINIDIDMIPDLASKISNNSGDKVKVQNALCTLILNELYLQLIESEESNYSNLEEMINNTLKYIESYEDVVIKPSKDIVLQYDDILQEELRKGNDLNYYIDVSIDDINNLVNDMDKAVTLKRLPIIKSMKDTINNMDECDCTSDEYIDYLKLLNNLNEAYKEIKES